MSFSLFSRSFPFTGLVERQLEAIQDAAAILDSIFRDFKDLPERCSRIRTIATECEASADEVARQLALTYLKPDERNDIYQLNVALQDAMLAIKNVSTRVGLYRCQIRSGAESLTGTLLEMFSECARLVANLIATSPNAGNLQKMRSLEQEAQMLLLVLLGETYESEPQMPHEMLEVVKWGQIYDRLEESILCASRIATIVEGIILKNV